MAAQRFDSQQRFVNDTIQALVNGAFNRRVQFIYNHLKNTGNLREIDKFMNETYFKVVGLLYPLYTIFGVSGDFRPPVFDAIGYNLQDLYTMRVPVPAAYETLNEGAFFTCPSYRSFLYNYINLKQKSAFFPQLASITPTVEELASWTAPPHLQTRFFTLEGLFQGTAEESLSAIGRSYKNGIREIEIPFIRDWYVTQLVLNTRDSIEATQAVVDDYLPKFSIAAYKEVVLQTMEKRKRVYPWLAVPRLKQ